jgi:uncharacterized membrane protein YccC
MAKPNRMFDLTVTDLEIIETALRARKASLSQRLVEDTDHQHKDQTGNADQASDLTNNVHQIHDLLGRLHNQKSFYRPKTGVYVGG